MNALVYADVPISKPRQAPSASTMQQMSISFGVALASLRQHGSSPIGSIRLRPK
jgi:hypothetical protein